MINKSEYKEWISKRKSIQFCQKENPGIKQEYWELIQEYGLPSSISSFLFWNENITFHPLTMYYKKKNYEKKFYEENVEFLEQYIFLCTYLGNAVCLNSKNGMIEEINISTFKAFYFNDSFETFVDSLVIFAKAVKVVENTDDELSFEQIDCLKEQLIEKVGKNNFEKSVWKVWIDSTISCLELFM